VDPAWAKADWPVVISLLEKVRGIDASFNELDDKLFAAHFNYGVQLVRQEQMDAAVEQFSAALEIFPEDIHAQGERRFALLYVQGSRRYDAQDWEGAITSFRPIFDINPEYKRTRQLLYASYYNDGWFLEKSGDLWGAKAHYATALQVNPQGSEAQVALARVTARLTPPTPTPTPIVVIQKRIEVNLSTFRATAWQSGRQVYNFLVGTGEPGRLTYPGNFSILDKIPMAYASTWGLKMPYWMGIYWAGSLENGFHGLPINRYGQKMWGGYLGTRISYGCIILADEDARKLYEWAQIGTPVWIHY
jgi:tetratricopeptide (TPR) repeat protein